MESKAFKTGQRIRCTVQGEYSINVTIEAEIKEICDKVQGDLRLVVKTSLGQKYLVHAADCEII